MKEVDKKKRKYVKQRHNANKDLGFIWNKK